MRHLVVAAALLGLLSGCSPGGSVGTHPAGSSAPPPTSTTAPPRPPGLSAPLPEARTEIAGAAWKGGIAVVGGLTAEGQASARVDFYDPAKNEWRALPDLPVALHHTAVGALPDDRLWVAGGFSMDGDVWVPRSDVWSLGADEEEWRIEPALSEARGALAATVVDDTLVVAGGTTRGDGRPEGASRTVEFIGPGERGWTRAPDLFEQREHLAMATSGDRALAIGGRVGGLDTNLRSVESWSPGEGTWRRELPLRKARGGFAGASVPGGACVAGGEEPGRTISLVECHRTGSWKVVAQLEEARHGGVVVALAGRLHVIGGGPKPGLTVSDLHEVLDIG